MLTRILTYFRSRYIAALQDRVRFQQKRIAHLIGLREEDRKALARARTEISRLEYQLKQKERPQVVYQTYIAEDDSTPIGWEEVPAGNPVYAGYRSWDPVGKCWRYQGANVMQTINYTKVIRASGTGEQS